MTRTMLKAFTLVATLISLAAGTSTASAMDIVCNIREVGVHGGGTSDARVVARCVTPVSGVEWIAVPVSNTQLAERFMDIASTAFLSGRAMYFWAPGTGSGCAGNCRITSQFTTLK